MKEFVEKIRNLCLVAEVFMFGSIALGAFLFAAIAYLFGPTLKGFIVAGGVAEVIVGLVMYFVYSKSKKKGN